MLDPFFAIAVTFLFAGLVKGVIGFGLPTVAVAVLSLIMAPVQAAALMVIPSFATNLWQTFAGTSLPGLLRRLWPLLLGICIGTWSMATFALAADGAASVPALGAVLVLYATFDIGSLRFALPANLERWISFGAGAMTGAITGVTGVFVIPAVPYLQALALERDQLVQALGLSFTVSTVALAASLFWAGEFPMTIATASLAALGPALAGMAIGQAARTLIRPALFRALFRAGLVLLGGHMLLR